MGMMKVNLIPKEYWPSCSHSPKTLSFRRNSDSTTTVFKTLNSVYFDPDSDSSNSDKNGENNDDDDIESIVQGAKSEKTRLFFEPSTGKAISLPAEAEEEETEDMVGPELFKESVVMAMESEDPYVDFKRSMQEMMEAHALLKDWGSLEELLAWYLRVNAKNNHAYIVAAFVDLLVKFSASSSSTSGSSTSDGVNSSLNMNISSLSTSQSSSSCARVHCRHRQMVVAGKSKSKSTTSFSSAASSFSSSDEAGEQR